MTARLPPLAALLGFLAAALAGCGGDKAKTGAAPAAGEAAASGPLARWHRGSEPGVWGRPVVIEALRGCRVRLAFRMRDAGAPDRIESRRDVEMNAGDSVRISWKVERASASYALAPPEADRAAGRSHLVAHVIQTSLDDEATALRSDPVWTREESPWVRVETTDPPPAALDFPAVEVTLAAVGVADAAGAPGPAGDALRLDVSASPPRLVGGAPAPPGAARHISAFVVSVLPPTP